MKRFGPIDITLEDVIEKYSDIIRKTTMTTNKNLIQECQNDSTLREISLRQDHILVVLGTEGLQFLSNVFRQNEFLSEDDFNDVYVLCDGFGKKTKEELQEINGGYDWSHIRDSSEHALAEAVLLTRQKMINLYNQN